MNAYIEVRTKKNHAADIPKTISRLNVTHLRKTYREAQWDEIDKSVDQKTHLSVMVETKDELRCF